MQFARSWRRVVALLFVLIAQGAQATDYPFTVSRVQANLYRVEGVHTLIETSLCFEYAIWDSAVLSLSTLSTGTLRFADGTTCTVTNVYQGRDLAMGTYPVQVSGSGQIYVTTDRNWLIQTWGYCGIAAMSTVGTLTLNRFATGGDANGLLNLGSGGSCSLAWIYRSIASTASTPLLSARPDLVVDYFLLPSSATAGQSLVVTSSVRNQGASTAGASHTRLYLSKDKTRNADDTEIGNCYPNSLPVGMSTACSGPVPLKDEIPAGTYYGIAVADADFEVGESNGDNNTATTVSTITVAGSPNPTLYTRRIGAGSGSVKTVDGSYACSNYCYLASSPGAVHKLIATPSFGSLFTAWSDVCTDLGACSVTIGGARRATARFDEAVTTLQMPWTTNASGYLSRFAIINKSARWLTYNLNMVTEAGNSVKLRPEVASGRLAPRSQLVIKSEQLVESFGGATRGTVTLSSDGTAAEISALYNLVQASTGSISNMAFLESTDRSSASSTLTLPWMTSSADYDTQLVLSNMKDQVATATLSLLAQPGSASRLLQTQIQIPARSQWVGSPADLVALNGSSAGLSLSIDAPSGLVKGSYVMTHRGTGAANATELVTPSSTSTGTTTLVVPWFSIVNGFDSQFVLVNRGNTPAAYTIQLMKEAANTLVPGTLTGVIPAQGQIEIPARTVLLSTDPSLTRAAAVFTVVAAPSQIEGSYQIRSQSTGALNQTVMVKPSARSTGTSTLVLPWFSRVNGYLSRFVLINRSTVAAPFTVEVLPEKGNAVAELKLAGGVIPAQGMLVLPADAVVGSFSNSALPRGGAVFRVKAADSDVEVLYNIVNQTTFSISNTLLTHTDDSDATAAKVPAGLQGVNYTNPTNNQAVGFISASDPLGRPLTFTLQGAPSAGTVTLDAVTGQFRYTPNSGGPTGGDRFTVQVFNGVQTSLVTVEVRAGGDPLLRYQWHLSNTGQYAFASNLPVAGNDLNVAGAWAMGYSGQGVKVGIIDDGLEIRHADLIANVDAANSHDFQLGGNDPTPKDPADRHGTKVAGIVAASAFNGIGGRGVAFGARLRGYNYLKSQGPVNLMNAMGGASYSKDGDLFNLSIGYTSTSLPSFSGEWQVATSTAMDLRGGLGAALVGAAGNFFEHADGETDVCALSRKFQVSCMDPATWERNGGSYPIVVGALAANGKKASYSNTGSSLWISAPGGEYGNDRSYQPDNSGVDFDPAIVTTNLSGCFKTTVSYNPVDTVGPNAFASNCEYTAKMNGTSSAAPNVSGVVALMLQANPKLSVRDIKHILATTARRVHPDHVGPHVALPMGGGDIALEQGWIRNAAGYWFNNWYGFGAIDASAAVDMARKTTQLLPAEAKSQTYSHLAPFGTTVPRGSRSGYEISIPVSGPASTVESAVLFFSLSSLNAMACVQIELDSPSGTRSILLHGASGLQNLSIDNSRLATHAFYGEPLNGTWKLRYVDLCSTGAPTTLSPIKEQTLIFSGR